jgi:hypothetical protein
VDRVGSCVCVSLYVMFDMCAFFCLYEWVRWVCVCALCNLFKVSLCACAYAMLYLFMSVGVCLHMRWNTSPTYTKMVRAAIPTRLQSPDVVGGGLASEGASVLLPPASLVFGVKACSPIRRALFMEVVLDVRIPFLRNRILDSLPVLGHPPPAVGYGTSHLHVCVHLCVWK